MPPTWPKFCANHRHHIIGGREQIAHSFRSCQDYLIAEGYDRPRVLQKKVILDVKYFYSQDGFKWVDLAPVDPETEERAKTLRTQLSGGVERGKVQYCNLHSTL